MKVILLFVASILLCGCISSYDMQCASDYETFPDRVQCFWKGYGSVAKNFESQTQHGGKYAYNEAVSCSDNLNSLVKEGNISDKDAWSVFLTYYFNPEDSDGICDVDGILNRLRERKAAQQFSMDREIEEEAPHRNP